MQNRPYQIKAGNEHEARTGLPDNYANSLL
jgi:hypothetical protein